VDDHRPTRKLTASQRAAAWQAPPAQTESPATDREASSTSVRASAFIPTGASGSLADSRDISHHGPDLHALAAGAKRPRAQHNRYRRGGAMLGLHRRSARPAFVLGRPSRRRPWPPCCARRAQRQLSRVATRRSPVTLVARSGSLMKSGPTPAFVLARVCAPAAQAWLPVSAGSSVESTRRWSRGCRCRGTAAASPRVPGGRRPAA
jgi:hypothetical protein